MQSYLDHHGDKLARRFDANSYVVLTESMLTHDLGRDRGGVEEALAQITAHALVVAVDTDRLFLPADCARIAAGIPGAEPCGRSRATSGTTASSSSSTSSDRSSPTSSASERAFGTDPHVGRAGPEAGPVVGARAGP